MIDHDSDSPLDAQLGDVPLPEGLLDRLRASLPANRSWSDEEIDAELGAIAVPPAVLARCRQAVQDEPLDSALCDVDVPGELTPALMLIPAREPVAPRRRALSKWERRLANLSLAASLAVLIGGGYLAALAAMFAGFRAPRNEPIALVVEHLGPLDIQTEAAPRVDVVIADSALDSDPNEESAAEQFVSWRDPSDVEEMHSDGPANLLLASLQSGFHPNRDMLLVRYGPLGSPIKSETVADFTAVLQGEARGLEPPAVRGFDRKFLLRQGVHPVVSPAAHEALRSLRVPLSTSTAAFELARQRLAEERWPVAADVRVEDFLAVVDYRFPSPPAGRLGLHLAGGPSPFGQSIANLPGAALLQVGVQAGKTTFRNLPATHLVVGLDASAAMRSSGRFDMARRALACLVNELGPRDRLSLVVFRNDELETVEAVGRENAGELHYFLERLEPRGNANLGLGLQEALSLALRNELDERLVQRVAVLTPGGAIVPHQTLDGLHKLATEAADREVGLTLFELESLPSANESLAGLASAARGELRSLATTDQLRFALLETLLGNNSIVAPDAALRVTFNPRVVAGYRLLGHEPNALSAAGPARLEVDLRSGQTATALFELWLLPGSQDELAVAEVEWLDPHTGEKQTARQSIGRWQLAGTLAESAPSLQQAAFAAEAAEVLRESYFVRGKPRSLQHVIDGAKAVSYDVSSQADFRRFITFLRDLEKVRGKRAE